jgi:hypothetical protein
MNFLHYDVWTQPGDIIQVSLTGNAANVLMMDQANFESYRSGRQFQYYGGYFTQSPAMIRAPGAGRWKVVVDLGGRAGQVRASVQVVRGM